MIGVQGGLMQFPGGQPIDGSDFSKRVTNCVLLTISVVSICVLVVCGVMIVREYALAKGYEAAQCKVTDIGYTDQEMSCRFCNAGGVDKTQGLEKGAKACVWTTFPCIQITVEYKREGKIQAGIIHPTSIQARGAYKKCSYNVCKRSYEENRAAIEEYAEPWEERLGNGHQFDCYYNTDNPENLIVEKKHDKTAVIHSMLWPSLVIIVCGVIFLKLETRRRGISFCGTAEFEKAKMERLAESVPLKNKAPVKSVVDMQINNGTAPSLSGQRRCMVKCKITRPSGQENSFISSSMTSIDRLTGVVDVSQTSPTNDTHTGDLSNGRVGVSVSADTIPHSTQTAACISATNINEQGSSTSGQSDRQQLIMKSSPDDVTVQITGSSPYSHDSHTSDPTTVQSGGETPV